MGSIDRGDRPSREESVVDRQGFDEVVEIMRRLGQGDEAAMVTLYERFGGPITAAVHHVAGTRGRRLPRDDAQSVVFEVCLELQKVAAAWSPQGGALPWVWARHRVANVVDRELGRWAQPLDEADLAQVEQVPQPVEIDADERAWATFERIVPSHESLRLLHEAFDRSGVSSRDRELYLEYECEKAAGNLAPATTLGPLFALKESAVRQAVRRVRQRLLRLAAVDERFSSLVDLPLFA